MNRNDFLKKLGFGALAVAIAPKVLAEKDDIIYPRLKDGVTIDTDLLPIRRSLIEEMRPYQQRINDGWSKLQASLYEKDYYHIGDVFSSNGREYLCVRKINEDNGYWEIVLRPFDPKDGDDIIIKATKELSKYYHHRESVLLKFND
jgi:hypothetical protein